MQNHVDHLPESVVMHSNGIFALKPSSQVGFSRSPSLQCSTTLFFPIATKVTNWILLQSDAFMT